MELLSRCEIVKIIIYYCYARHSIVMERNREARQWVKTKSDLQTIYVNHGKMRFYCAVSAASHGKKMLFLCAEHDQIVLLIVDPPSNIGMRERSIGRSSIHILDSQYNLQLLK